MKVQKYDVLVIGSGPGGESAAYKSARSGKKVAVIDMQFGGTCALKGCTPKKVLAVASEVLRYACRMDGYGINQKHITLNWPDLIHYKNSFTEPVPFLRKDGFTKNGIDVIEGKAGFYNENTLEVEGEYYQADVIVIATGNCPRQVEISGSEYLTNATDLFEMETLPGRISFIGGGFVAFEFAQILAKAGCEVNIFERSDTPLGAFDPVLVGQLVEMFGEEGINIHLGSEVNSIEAGGGFYKVNITQRDGVGAVFNADLVVNAAGRVPNISALNLEKGKVAFKAEGIEVDGFLQSTTNKNVYAIGDAVGRLPFTLSADYEGNMVAGNLSRSKRRKISYKGFPIVLFTSPKLASVGYTKAKLDEEGMDYEIKQGDFDKGLMTRSTHEKYNRYIIYHQGDDILGAHLFSLKADEVINAFAMAIQHGLTMKDIKKTFVTYPSAFSEIRKMV